MQTRGYFADAYDEVPMRNVASVHYMKDNDELPPGQQGRGCNMQMYGVCAAMDAGNVKSVWTDENGRVVRTMDTDKITAMYGACAAMDARNLKLQTHRLPTCTRSCVKYRHETCRHGFVDQATRKEGRRLVPLRIATDADLQDSDRSGAVCCTAPVSANAYQHPISPLRHVLCPRPQDVKLLSAMDKNSTAT